MIHCTLLTAVFLFQLSCTGMLDSYPDEKTVTGGVPEQVLPKPAGSFFIENGNVYAPGTSVTLNMSVTDAAEMRFSNDGNTWSSWEPYGATKAWTLASGHKTLYVYAEFRHSQGGILSISDSIISLIQEKITASDGHINDYFGGYLDPGHQGSCISISSDGNTIVIGAHMDDIDGKSDQGAAYVYRWNGYSWSETKITASDGDAIDYFGFSVSISDDGNTIVISSFLDNVGSTSDQGSAYVYRWNGSAWVETKIVSSDGTADNRFGTSVSIS